jgi:hypothetical protein
VKIQVTWLWLESKGRFVRLEELTPEEKLLRSIEAPDYGLDIESTWEECCRRDFEEMMKGRISTDEDDSDEDENSEY